MRIALWIITAAFGAYTLWAISQVGYIGIWAAGFDNPGSLQVLLDLVVSSVLLVGFVVRDAREKGRTWWPWAVVTVFGGSFGTLGYLLWPHQRAVGRAVA